MNEETSRPITGLELVVRMLVYEGSMCPDCGYATRKTSKRWARCKRCGKRVPRRELPDPPERKGEDR